MLVQHISCITATVFESCRYGSHHLSLPGAHDGDIIEEGPEHISLEREQEVRRILARTVVE